MADSLKRRRDISMKPTLFIRSDTPYRSYIHLCFSPIAVSLTTIDRRLSGMSPLTTARYAYVRRWNNLSRLRPTSLSMNRFRPAIRPGLQAAFSVLELIYANIWLSPLNLADSVNTFIRPPGDVLTSWSSNSILTQLYSVAL